MSHVNPSEGGSYTFNPKTGKYNLVQQTLPPNAVPTESSNEVITDGPADTEESDPSGDGE